MGKVPEVPRVALTEEELTKLLAALQEACNNDGSAVTVAPEDIKEHSHDQSRYESHPPTVVVCPNTVEEVASVVRACVAARVPMIPRGAGTGLEGGAIPYGGGVVINTQRLRTMELMEEEMLAVCGAGIYKAELQKFLEPKGLLFGPDPASNPSLGGMASTGGSGMTTLRYGTVKENVVSLVVVTAEGEIVRTRAQVRKSSSGYELTQLFMGSEGTLGIICELTVRVRRQMPLRSGGMLHFADIKAAVDTVVATVRADPPSLVRCEMLNAQGVDGTNRRYKTTLPVRPTLFLELKGNDAETMKREFDSIVAIAQKFGVDPTEVKFAPDGETLDEVWEARRGLHYAAVHFRGVPGGEKCLSTDVCVPISKLAACAADAEALAASYNLPCVICAHIADANFHCVMPYQDSEYENLLAFEHKLIDMAIEYGGTVTGEHGVGIGKVAHSSKEHGDAHVRLQWAVKKALDPHNLMNPGKVLPWPAPSAKL